MSLLNAGPSIVRPIRGTEGLHAVKLLLLVVVHCIFPFKGLLENAPLYNPDFHDGI